MTHVHITLFAGRAGWIIGLLALWGAVGICCKAESWLRSRFTLDLHPLVLLRKSGDGWSVTVSVPRRVRVHRRWDRPGALVTMTGGREGAILYVVEDDAAPGTMALVQLYDDDDCQIEPQWAALESLSPLPRENAFTA